MQPTTEGLEEYPYHQQYYTYYSRQPGEPLGKIRGSRWRKANPHASALRRARAILELHFSQIEGTYKAHKALKEKLPNEIWKFRMAKTLTLIPTQKWTWTMAMCLAELERECERVRKMHEEVQAEFGHRTWDPNTDSSEKPSSPEDESGKSASE